MEEMEPAGCSRLGVQTEHPAGTVSSLQLDTPGRKRLMAHVTDKDVKIREVM